MSEEALTNIADLIGEAPPAPLPRDVVVVAGEKSAEIRVARPLDDFDKQVLQDVEREVRRPLKALLRSGPSVEEHAALVAERKAIVERGGRPPAVQPTRDILIQKQYDVMKAAAPAVLRRLVRGAIDESDPLHERCLDIVAKRVAPIAFFESLAKSEFKSEEEGGAGPRVSIHIHTTQAPKLETPGDVVDIPFTEKAE